MLKNASPLRFACAASIPPDMDFLKYLVQGTTPLGPNEPLEKALPHYIRWTILLSCNGLHLGEYRGRYPKSAGRPNWRARSLPFLPDMASRLIATCSGGAKSLRSLVWMLFISYMAAHICCPYLAAGGAPVTACVGG